jgi:tRNA(adenine34) deaminase
MKPAARVPHRSWPAVGEHATDLDRTMMARAIDLARHAATIGEVPVGAVVYRADTGEVIAQAHNRRETDDDPAGHAELIAMRDAADNLAQNRPSGLE